MNDASSLVQSAKRVNFFGFNAIVLPSQAFEAALYPVDLGDLVAKTQEVGGPLVEQLAADFAGFAGYKAGRLGYNEQWGNPEVYVAPDTSVPEAGFIVTAGGPYTGSGFMILEARRGLGLDHVLEGYACHVRERGQYGG